MKDKGEKNFMSLAREREYLTLIINWLSFEQFSTFAVYFHSYFIYILIKYMSAY